MSTSENEAKRSTEKHRECSEDVLECYDKSWDNVFAIASDNFPVNASLSRSVGLLLVGCASHCFILAIKEMVESSLMMVKKEQGVMKNVKYGVSAACMRTVSLLSAVLLNDIC